MLANTSTTLYIGTYAVHLARISKGLDGHCRLLDYKSVEFPPNDNATPSEKLITALRTAFTQIPVASQNVRVALAGADTLIRFFEMPLLPKKEQWQSMYFEAQKYLPIDAKELYYSAHLAPDKKEKKLEVVFYAGKKAVIDVLLNLLYSEGAASVSVEPAAMPLIRAYRFCSVETKSEAAQAFVDLEEGGTANIIISKKGVIMLERDFSVPLMTENQPDYQALRTEIQLSMNYYSKNHKNESVDKLVLLSSSKINPSELEKNLKTDLEMPVESIPFCPKIKDFPRLEAAVAILLGLALRNPLGRDAVKPTNLATEDAHKNLRVPTTTPVSWEDEKKKWQTRIGMEAAGFFLLFLMTHFLMNSGIEAQKKELQKQMGRLPKPAILADAEVTADAIQAAELELIEKKKVLAAIFDERVYLTVKMGEVARLIRENVRLTGFIFTDAEGAADSNRSILLRLDGQVQAEGSETPLQSLNRWIAELKKSKDLMVGLTGVRIASAQKTSSKPGTPMTFSLEGR